MTTRYWIGVASREHVKAAEAGGFCQFCHGREAPVRKLSAGDGVVYYSPREHMGEGARIRAFTAIGRVRPGTAYLRESNQDASIRGAAMSTISLQVMRRSPLCSTNFPSRGRTRIGDG